MGLPCFLVCSPVDDEAEEDEAAAGATPEAESVLASLCFGSGLGLCSPQCSHGEGPTGG